MIGRLNHVAIAVPDIAPAAAQYRQTLGAEVAEPFAQPEHGVTVVFITLPNTKIELLEPLGETSPIAAFLERNPAGGIHHICYEVDDIIAARDQAEGVRRARAGRRQAEDRRARQAGAVPASQGLQRHAGRVGAGMSITLAIAVYIVIWWTVLFAVLPIGVRTQGEDGGSCPARRTVRRPRRACCASWSSPRRSQGCCSAPPWGMSRYGLVDLQSWVGRSLPK